MRVVLFLLVVVFVIGCRHSTSAKDASIPEAGTSDGALDTPCGRMCHHFRVLKCDEGEDFYDSDVPGPVNVPNTTCESFCESQMKLGVDLNTACVTKTPTCEEIEVYRAMMSCN